MDKLLNEKGEKVELLKNVVDVEYKEVVLETSPFLLKVKEEKLGELKEKVKALRDKGKIEKALNRVENFIIGRMKKKKGIVMSGGDFDKSYSLFKEALDL